MLKLGLLMINGENDVLERVIREHERIVDLFYVLDGTVPNDESRRICLSSPRCVGYLTDAELPRPPYPDRPVDGYRQALYEQAVHDHGYDNWFVLLHGDEIWDSDPAKIIDGNPGADAFTLLLPFYFPREGERWHDDRHPLDQLHWRLGPGYPELRLFRGGAQVGFDPGQHHNVTPHGLTYIVRTSHTIRHYLYRGPAAQQERARRHANNGFDPDNYRHLDGAHGAYWTNEMIARYQQQPYWTELSQ